MIKALAQRIAKTMGAQLQADRDKVEIFTYGLEIILGTLLQLTFLILLSLFMDTFVTTMICMIAFASLRYFGGGIHLSTYYGCLIVGVTLLLALGKLATVDISLEALIVISIVAFLMGTFTIYLPLCKEG
jgi:accessory gene regulator B